jgi:hypothetical protein
VPAPRGTGTAGPTVVVSAARGAALLLAAPHRGAALLLAALAASYVLAVGVWLWSLRDGITGPDVSTGVMLIGIAICWRG